MVIPASTVTAFYVRLCTKNNQPGWDGENRERLQETMTQTQDTQNPQETRPAEAAADLTALVTAAESLLFVAGRPLDYTELRKLLDVNDTRLARVLEVLTEQLESQGRGIRVQRLETQVQLVTAPENARYIAALLGLPMTAKLTTAAMETLAVISYRQPMTRAQIEAVRGVNSDRALASLIQHGLVAEVGRAQTVGRPALFATTADFLQQFGLTTLAELPHVQQPDSNAQNGQHAETEQPEQLTLESQNGQRETEQLEQLTLEDQNGYHQEPATEPQLESEEQNGLQQTVANDEPIELAEQNGHQEVPVDEQSGLVSQNGHHQEAPEHEWWHKPEGQSGQQEEA